MIDGGSQRGKLYPFVVECITVNTEVLHKARVGYRWAFPHHREPHNTEYPDIKRGKVFTNPPLRTPYPWFHLSQMP